jgi:hypothetical protein
MFSSGLRGWHPSLSLRDGYGGRSGCQTHAEGGHDVPASGFYFMPDLKDYAIVIPTVCV